MRYSDDAEKSKNAPQVFQDFQSSNQHGTVVKSPFFEKKCVLWARFPVRRVVYICIYIYLLYLESIYIYIILLYIHIIIGYIYIYAFFVLSYIYILLHYVILYLYYIILLILYFYYYMIYILYFYTYMYISYYIIHVILCILYCMYILLYIFYNIFMYIYVCMCYTSFLDSTYECQQPGTLVKMKTAGINIDALSQESGNIGLERFWYIHIHPHSPHRGTSSSPICFPCFPIIFLMFCQIFPCFPIFLPICFSIFSPKFRTTARVQLKYDGSPHYVLRYKYGQPLLRSSAWYVDPPQAQVHRGGRSRSTWRCIPGTASV